MRHEKSARSLASRLHMFFRMALLARVNQDGQVLAITLIVVVITAALTVPLLGLISSVLLRSFASTTTLEEQYSVDAGIEDAIWRANANNDPVFADLVIQNAAPSYDITVNGQTVTIDIPVFVLLMHFMFYGEGRW